MKLFEKKKEGCEGAAVARSPGHRKAGVVVVVMVVGRGAKKKGRPGCNWTSRIQSDNDKRRR